MQRSRERIIGEISEEISVGCGVLTVNIMLPVISKSILFMDSYIRV